MSDLVERYLACWNETDADARDRLVGELFADDASYTDPMAEVTGADAIAALIGAVQQQFPGFVFTPGDLVDEHHQQARFTWGLGPAGQPPVVEGFDVVRLTGERRIDTVLGFLDRVPA